MRRSGSAAIECLSQECLNQAVRIERVERRKSDEEPKRRAWTKDEFIERVAANPDLSEEYKRFANQLVSILARFPSVRPFWARSHPLVRQDVNGYNSHEIDYRRYT